VTPKSQARHQSRQSNAGHKAGQFQSPPCQPLVHHQSEDGRRLAAQAPYAGKFLRPPGYGIRHHAIKFPRSRSPVPRRKKETTAASKNVAAPARALPILHQPHIRQWQRRIDLVQLLRHAPASERGFTRRSSHDDIHVELPARGLRVGQISSVPAGRSSPAFLTSSTMPTIVLHSLLPARMRLPIGFWLARRSSPSPYDNDDVGTP